MDVGALPIIVSAILVIAGILLGGAIAHWRRGTGYIITGAVIGGALMLIPAVIAAVGMAYAPYIVTAVVVVAIVIYVFGSVFG